MATSWLFTSVAEDLNSGRPRTNPTSGKSVTRTRDRGIASPTRWPLGHEEGWTKRTDEDDKNPKWSTVYWVLASHILTMMY